MRWWVLVLLLGRRRRGQREREGQEREQDARSLLHACIRPRRASGLAGWKVLPERVEPAQDLDRLGAQRAVQRAPVLLGELAGAVVELGVADLAVLGLLGGLEVVALARASDASLAAARPRAQRRADHEHDDGEHHDDDQQQRPRAGDARRGRARCATRAA